VPETTKAGSRSWVTMRFHANLGFMKACTVLIVTLAACSSPPAPKSGGSGVGDSGAIGSGEPYLTRRYAPPANPKADCPGGAPAQLAPEWLAMKVDDRVSPAKVAVRLDATCLIDVGELPRLCARPATWKMTCTNRDGSRPHVGEVRCSATAVEIFVVTPDGEVRVAELPRGANAPPCP
jgi:hypothetical protein